MEIFVLYTKRLSLHQLLCQSEDLRKQRHINMDKVFENYVHTLCVSSGEAYHEDFTATTMHQVARLLNLINRSSEPPHTTKHDGNGATCSAFPNFSLPFRKKTLADPAMSRCQ